MSNLNLLDQLSFKESKERLDGVINDTKLIYSTFFSNLYGNSIYLKPENLQKTGAFKIRGAYNRVAKLSDEEKKYGIIASSAGNHAQGVAYAAKELGVKATIVMPSTTPLIKVEATKSYGADVVLHGDVYDEAYAKACSLQEQHNYTFVHPFNDIDVIEGQGTIGLEILEEINDTDIILVPIGGGGLIAGIALAAKSINPNVKIIGVEPEEAQSMKISLDNKRVTTLERVNTIADGTAVKTPGQLTFDICKDYVDEIITVSDLELMESFLQLVQHHKLVAENSGLLSIAALKKLGVRDKKVVSVISGGNIDILTISDLVNQGLVYTGRVSCFSVNVTDKPGELQKITDALASLGANIVNIIHHPRRARNIFTDVNLEVTVETNGHSHVESITEGLSKLGYSLTKIY